ncbi:MAG: prolyl oligopeptidase family serine peptidase, partial [Verrucomicrobiae bacterium]|nr:prolyl oligopeptidase family serine peptidase [Verrucomicrobiae bacterium]
YKRQPDFQPPDSLEEWLRQRDGIRAKLKELLGDLPPKPNPVAVRIVSRTNHVGAVLEKFEFDNGAGDVVPGYFLLPANRAGKVPAILYCHWHGGHYDVGKEELFRTNATPVPPGPALVNLGFAIMAIDAYCFGERNGTGPGGPSEKGSAGEMTAAKFNLWVGRTLWGMMLRDELIALEYLRSRPEIDATRTGVTGISMGATRTWWLMALDDRLKAGVAVCCLTRYQNLISSEALAEHGIYYFVPGMLRHFDTEAVVALAAPRPLLLQCGEKDRGSPVDGIRLIEKKTSKVYGLYGSQRNFQTIIYDGVGHVYTPEMWNRTVTWLTTHLKGQ